jgi:Ca2+-binding EF-hand superfamily protein
MGNTAVAGHALNFCGCTDGSFEASAKFLISINNIEAWNARALIKENLKKQSDLARRSPLRFVPVKDGLSFISSRVSGFFRTLSRDLFVRLCLDLLHFKEVQNGPKDRDELYDIYDSMDFDRSGTLSLGEWAGGLSVFFKGDTSQCVQAVFSALDVDNSDTITKKELHEYLKPFVKAMTPAAADALRPLLLKKATDDIYKEMDMDEENDISSEEMLEWTRRGNNIVDRLADIIDGEVYRICLAERERKLHSNLTGGWEGLLAIDNLSQKYPLPGIQHGQEPPGRAEGAVDAYHQAYPPASSPHEWSPVAPCPGQQPAPAPWNQAAQARGWDEPLGGQAQPPQHSLQPQQPQQALEQYPPQEHWPQQQQQWQAQQPPQQQMPPQGMGGYGGPQNAYGPDPPSPDGHPGAHQQACKCPSTGGPPPNRGHSGSPDRHDPFQGHQDFRSVPPPPPPPQRSGYGRHQPPPPQHTLPPQQAYGAGAGEYDARPPTSYSPYDARPPTVPYGGASPYGPSGNSGHGGYGGY